MQMVSGRELACVAHQGYRGACRYLVACFLQKLLVVLVNRNYVRAVLDLYCIACFFQPS